MTSNQHPPNRLPVTSRRNEQRERRVNRAFDATPLFQVIIDCPSEAVQRQLYEQLRAAGHACRLLVL